MRREERRKSHRDTRGGMVASAIRRVCTFVCVFVCMCATMKKAKGENGGRDGGWVGKSVTVIFGIWVTHKPQLVP